MLHRSVSRTSSAYVGIHFLKKDMVDFFAQHFFVKLRSAIFWLKLETGNRGLGFTQGKRNTTPLTNFADGRKEGEEVKQAGGKGRFEISSF